MRFKSMRSRIAGFTLLEVMIALAIFAICAGVLIEQVNRSAQQEAYLIQKNMALWIAENKLSELRVERKLNKGSSNQTIDFSGQQWRVNTDVQETKTEAFYKVEVSVYPPTQDGVDLNINAADANALFRLVGFIGEH